MTPEIADWWLSTGIPLMLGTMVTTSLGVLVAVWAYRMASKVA